jgi:hypothetical protein
MANITDTQVDPRISETVLSPIVALIERIWPVAAVGFGGLLTLGWIGFLGYNAFGLLLMAF